MTSKASDTPDISVVFSFWNEEDNLEELIKRTVASLEGADATSELIFVNDVSTDGSMAILQSIHDADPRIKVLTTSRNIGVNPCYIAGMHYSTGKAVITLDADLQDPPEVMAEMIEKWREGADVVYTTRSRREGESAFKMLVTKYAYRIINIISDVPLPVDAGMYRLMNRRVVDQLLVMNENEPYLRGLITWVGFKQVPLEYTRHARHAGETHFPLLSKAPMAEFLRAILSFSQAPIHILLACGLALTALSAFGILAAVLLHLIIDLPLTYALIAGFTFFAGSQWIAAGLIGLYIGRIWTQVKGRPQFIIESTIGFPDNKC